MLEDLVPILEAAKIIPIRIRGGGSSEPVQVNLPRMTQGCFDCTHTSLMSPRRQYATLVGYTEGVEAARPSAIFGMVVATEDRGILNLPNSHWLHESILATRTHLMANTVWDILKFQDDDSRIYVRKWIDYRSINGMTHVTGIIDLDNILDDYLDQFEEISIQVYYNRHERGMYFEPRPDLHVFQSFNDRQIGNMVRFAPRLFSPAQKREILSQVWPRFLNLATGTTSSYISLLTELPRTSERLIEPPLGRIRGDMGSISSIPENHEFNDEVDDF